MNDASHANRACPYFGLLDDADTSLAFPSIWSGCHRSLPVDPPNLRHQAEYCLGENHLQCTVFQSQQEAAPLPAHLCSSRSHARESKRSPIRTFAFIFIGIVILAGLGWFFLTPNFINLPAATPTPSATPQPTATESASPTTVRASKTPIATKTVTASPSPGSVTVTFTMTAAASFTSTYTAARTPTLTVTLTASPTATYTATRTATPTRTPTRTPTKTPTSTSTATRTVTPTPTLTSTKPPTSTNTATLVKTAAPTVSLSKHGLDMPIGNDYKFVIHRVLDGENLNQFADKYNTSVEAILAVNYNLQPPVWVDSLVVIPVKFTEVASLPAFETYQVTQAGKSLDALAQELGVSAADLKYYNAIGDAESLLAGDWLLIPRPRKPAP